MTGIVAVWSLNKNFSLNKWAYSAIINQGADDEEEERRAAEEALRVAEEADAKEEEEERAKEEERLRKKRLKAEKDRDRKKAARLAAAALQAAGAGRRHLNPLRGLLAGLVLDFPLALAGAATRRCGSRSR